MFETYTIIGKYYHDHQTLSVLAGQRYRQRENMENAFSGITPKKLGGIELVTDLLSSIT